MNNIISIAKKEYMDNIRSTWIIVLSVLFALLMTVVSYYGSQGLSQDWRPLEDTISSLESLIILIVPIISLMLGYAAIVGESEKGSMSSLLSLPVNRYEIIIGKFLGLSSVITSTILIGFGISGILIAVNAPSSDYTPFFQFIAITILLGLSFLSISLFFSSIFKKRSTAMGGAIFLWFFFAIIWQIIVIGLLFAYVLSEGIGNMDPNSYEMPGWFYPLMLSNPLMIFSTANYPNAPDIYIRILSPIIWIIGPLILTIWRFKGLDV